MADAKYSEGFAVTLPKPTRANGMTRQLLADFWADQLGRVLELQAIALFAWPRVSDDAP